MYLDPGFGGMLLQVIIAIVAVGGGIIYSFRRKIKAFFTKNKTENKEVTKRAAPSDTLNTIDELDEEEKSKEVSETV